MLVMPARLPNLLPCLQRGGPCARCCSVCVLGLCPGVLSRGPGCRRCGNCCRGCCRPCFCCFCCCCPRSLVAPQQLTRLLIVWPPSLPSWVAWHHLCSAPPLLPAVVALAPALITMACYDREVNCRRAAAAAFQVRRCASAGARVRARARCCCRHVELKSHAGSTPPLASPSAYLVRACLPAWLPLAAGVCGSAGQLLSRHRHPHSRRLLHRQRAPKREC